MASVLNAALVFVALLVIFRVAGRRTVLELTNFDFVLLLIVSEATQSALVGKDVSVTGSLLVVITLVMLNVGLSLVKQRWPNFDRWVEGIPVVLVRNGKVLGDRLKMSRVELDDIQRAAREFYGIGTLEEIEYAVLEANGKISIIPVEEADNG